jgi:hypothetical protein
VAAFLAPQVDGWVTRALDDRTNDELDDQLERAIDFLARLRSDDRRSLIAGAGGAFVAKPHHDELVDGWSFTVGDPVRGPDLRDGGDGLGQEHPGEAAALELSGTAAGDRPER